MFINYSTQMAKSALVLNKLNLYNVRLQARSKLLSIQVPVAPLLLNNIAIWKHSVFLNDYNIIFYTVQFMILVFYTSTPDNLHIIAHPAVLIYNSIFYITSFPYPYFRGSFLVFTMHLLNGLIVIVAHQVTAYYGGSIPNS